MTWPYIIASIAGTILYIFIGIFVQALAYGEYNVVEDDELGRALFTVFWPLVAVAYALDYVFGGAAKLTIKLALKIREKRNK